MSKITNIFDYIYQCFLQKKVTLQMTHIFAHVGVSHNETVDAVANRLRLTINLHVQQDIGDIRRNTIQYIQSLWHQQYTEPGVY